MNCPAHVYFLLLSLIANVLPVGGRRSNVVDNSRQNECTIAELTSKSVGDFCLELDELTILKTQIPGIRSELADISAALNELLSSLTSSTSSAAPATTAPQTTQAPTVPNTETATTEEPTFNPTEIPTFNPTEEPTFNPTEEPSFNPTEEPSFNPTEEASFNPTEEPTKEPSFNLTEEPTEAELVDTCSFTHTRTVEVADCDATFWLTGSVQTKLASKGKDLNICMIDNGGHFEWGVFDGDAVYRTCVQASATTTEACDTNSYVCNGEAVGNANAQSWALSYITRANYQHQDCPSIQSTCTSQNNWFYNGIKASSSADDSLIENNVCLGDDNMVRIVTKEGVVNTCVGFKYENGNVDNLTCPNDRDYLCGTAAKNGRQVFGWPTAQWSLIGRALEEDNYVHPDCGPFLTCC